MIFLCYEKCSTCKKAKNWLLENGLQFEMRDIKQDHPNREELREWQARSGLPLRRFFNTSGMLYRSLGLKERLPSMSDEEQLALLASDGMLVKRPILVLPDRVLVGFRAAEWEAALAK